MSSYPVAYRRKYVNENTGNQRKGGRGFQPPSPVAVPRPANDNLPLPANDNIRQLLSPEKRAAIRAVSLVGFRSVRKAPIPAARLVDAALTVFEVASDMYRQRKVTPRAAADIQGLTAEPEGWSFDIAGVDYVPSGHTFVKWIVKDSYGPASIASGKMTPAASQWTGFEEVADHWSLAATWNGVGFGYLFRGVWQNTSTGRYMNAMNAAYPLGGSIYRDNPAAEVEYRPGVEAIPSPLTPRQARAALRFARASQELFSGSETPKREKPVEQTAIRPNELAISTVGPAPAAHASRPPPMGEKHSKFQASSVAVFRQVGAIFGTVTEVGDFTDALWDALPPSAKSGYREVRWYNKATKKWGKRWKKIHNVSMQRKQIDLFQHADELDILAAAKNVAANQLQDALIGKFGSKQQEAAKEYLNQIGRPVGFGTGPAL